MKGIPENISQISKALLPLLIIIGLFLFLGKIGLSKITEIRAEITRAEDEKLLLTEKLDLLRTVAVNGVHDSNSATTALPDNSPALVVIYQLRNLAASNGLVLSSIKSKINANDGTDLQNITVSFNVMGGKSVVQSFLAQVESIAPISLLNKVKLSEINGVVTGDVAVVSYWSALPTQLPASIDGFQELTEIDNQILSQVNGLTQPTFVSLPPAENQGKLNPFIQ